MRFSAGRSLTKGSRAVNQEIPPRKFLPLRAWRPRPARTAILGVLGTARLVRAAGPAGGLGLLSVRAVLLLSVLPTKFQDFWLTHAGLPTIVPYFPLLGVGGDSDHAQRVMRMSCL